MVGVVSIVAWQTSRVAHTKWTAIHFHSITCCLAMCCSSLPILYFSAYLFFKFLIPCCAWCDVISSVGTSPNVSPRVSSVHHCYCSRCHARSCLAASPSISSDGLVGGGMGFPNFFLLHILLGQPLLALMASLSSFS